MNKKITLALILWAVSFSFAWSDCKCQFHSDHFADLWSSDRKNGLVVCGVFDKKVKNWVYSNGIEVSKCISGEKLLLISEVYSCSFLKDNGRIIIRQLMRWPFEGIDSAWKDVPCYEYQFQFKDNGKLEIKEYFILEPPNYSKFRIQGIIQKYKKTKDALNGPGEEEFRRKNGSYEQDIMGQMLACALLGNEQAQNIIPRMGKDLKVDGENAEMFADITEIYGSYLEVKKNGGDELKFQKYEEP